MSLDRVRVLRIVTEGKVGREREMHYVNCNREKFCWGVQKYFGKKMPKIGVQVEIKTVQNILKSISVYLLSIHWYH